MSSADTTWITIRQWHSDARHLERRHLRQYGVSWSATTIAHRARACIVEIQTECVRVRPGWRRAMQRAADEAYPGAAQDSPTPSPWTISPPLER
jgi:hypothetical protein